MIQPITYFIQGNSIYLRDIRLSDANETYCNWLNDQSVNQYLESRYKTHSLEDIQSYIQALIGNTQEILMAICLKGSDKHIGNIKLGPINSMHRFADIGLLIGDKHAWGKGYGAEAIELISHFAFADLDVNKLQAGCYEDNIGSVKAFEKVGFKREGLLKNKWFCNGRFQDEIILGLCKRDWTSIRVNF